jgi:hypothetical protein
MDTYHAAFWSDPSYSSSDEDENRYKFPQTDLWLWEKYIPGDYISPQDALYSLMRNQADRLSTGKKYFINTLI